MQRILTEVKANKIKTGGSFIQEYHHKARYLDKQIKLLLTQKNI